MQLTLIYFCFQNRVDKFAQVVLSYLPLPVVGDSFTVTSFKTVSNEKETWGALDIDAIISRRKANWLIIARS